MHKIKSAFLIGCVILISGCKTSSPNMDFNYPTDIAATCVRARDSAKLAIEKCGTPLRVIYGCKVIKVKGEKFISGMWCWNYPGIGYVGGLAQGGNIKVGCNPITGGQVSYGVLLHENGHYWLISNKGDGTHNPQYDPAFHWSGLGRTTFASYIIDENGDMVPVNIKQYIFADENGDIVSIDAILP